MARYDDCNSTNSEYMKLYKYLPVIDNWQIWKLRKIALFFHISTKNVPKRIKLD